MGKGGAGKSIIAGTLCRLLATSGHPVLALDVDTMPGLAFSIGTAGRQARLPAGLAERVEGKGWRVLAGLRPSRLVDRYAASGPDGIRLLELGKLPESVEPTVTVAFRYVMERFRRAGWVLVADLAAGTRQPMFRWARFASTVIVVADPTAKSLITARRLAKVSTHLLANRVSSRADLTEIREAVNLPLLGAIPYDEALAEADRQGVPPIDLVPDSAGVGAIRDLAVRLAQGKD